MVEARSQSIGSSALRDGLIPVEKIVRHLLLEKKFKRQRSIWPLLAGLVLVALTAVSCGGAAGESPRAGADEAGSDGEQASVDLEHPSLGDENAPVVLTEYADYQ